MKFQLFEGRKKGNNARYMPALLRPDGRRFFHGFTYHSNIGDQEAAPIAGIGLGLVNVNEGKSRGISLEQGGHLVQTAPLPNGTMPKPRDFTVKDEKDPRRYIDFGTFKEIGDQLFLRAWAGERKVNVEVVTGVLSKESAHQLRAFGSWHALCHGSVALTGAPRIMVDTGANATVDHQLPQAAGMGALPNILATQAKMRGKERKGEVIGDCPLWISRTWELEYSKEGSQAILVRQFDVFVVIVVLDDGKALEDISVHEEKFKDKFEVASFDQAFLPELPAAAA